MVSPRQRTLDTADAVLASAGAVAPLDVLQGLGWVTGNHVDQWRQGRTSCIAPLEVLRPAKLIQVLDALEHWAQERGLLPSEISYVGTTRERRALRFTPSGDDDLERRLRTQWISGELPAPKRERVIEKANTPPELVVIEPIQEFTCATCAGSGDHLVMEDAGPLCLTCADLDMLEFLPAGEATLTRRARKASGLSAVVVRWSRARKRYERQGVLVEEAALREAEASCHADEDVRLRQRERDRARRATQDVELVERMAGEIRTLFPGCPVARARAIAVHTAVRGSGRVGRSAAGRGLAEDALAAAVVASIRHEDTTYDELLMSGVPRDEARARIRGDVDGVLATWRTG